MPNDVVWSWDAHQGGNIVSPPANIMLDIPKGPDRLFQILVVSENENGQMQFLYGDTVKTLAASAEDVSVSVASIGSGGEEAEIGGRYLTGDNVGPTGDLELMFQPPGLNRPAMKIFNTVMVNGWFQLFMISGAPFTYRWVHNGATLFSGNGFSDTEFTPITGVAHKLHLIRPAGYSYYQKGGGVYVTEARAAARVIGGYFGPAAATYGKPACYTAAQTMQSFYSDIGHTTAILYDPASTASSKTRRLNNQGGVSFGTGGCANGNAFIDWVKVDGKYAGNGRDQTFGFRGIFVSPPNNSTIASSYNSGTQTMTLSWTFLPGVVGVNGVDGVAIYAHPNFDGGMEMGGDGIDCEKLQSVGFSWVGDTSSSSFSFPVTSGTQNTTKAALCPYKLNYAGRAKYLFMGTRYENQGGGGSAGSMLVWKGSGGGIATKTVQNNNCYNFEIEAMNGGSPAIQSSTLNINVQSSGPAASLYDAPDCGGAPITGSTTIATGSSKRIVSFLSTTNGYKNYNFNASGFGQASAQLSVYSGVDANKLEISMLPSVTAVGRCMVGEIRLENSAPEPAVNSSATTVTLTYSGASGFFSDHNCTTPLTGANNNELNIPPLTQRMGFFFKATATQASSPVTATAPSPFSSGSDTFNVQVGSSNLTQYGGNIYSPPNYYYNSCYPFEVNSMNEIGARVLVPAATTVTVSTVSSGVAFYSDPSCGNLVGVSHNVSISAGNDFSQTLWFKGTSPGAVQIDFTSSPGPITGNKNFTLF
ncbi:MAG: hypothetical protein A4S09_11865 [Proteobacteria bacterium SG_bin7]|nr:MAG: hypothetical protein A4S09_11865 [Proteobacteria bacterium SG_bin7]